MNGKIAIGVYTLRLYRPLLANYLIVSVRQSVSYVRQFYLQN